MRSGYFRQALASSHRQSRQIRVLLSMIAAAIGDKKKRKTDLIADGLIAAERVLCCSD